MTHKQLEAWKESINFVVQIYEVTKNFPNDELYGLTNQIRKSAVSIPSNIAEGCARRTAKDTIYFLYIAVGFVAELETQLIIAKELNFITSIDAYIDKLNHIKKLLIGLIKFHNSKK